MEESLTDLANLLRKQAEAIEGRAQGKHDAVWSSERRNEEERLQDVLSLAQERLALIKIEELQSSLADVDQQVQELTQALEGRKQDGRPTYLTLKFLELAEAERKKLHAKVDEAFLGFEEGKKRTLPLDNEDLSETTQEDLPPA